MDQSKNQVNLLSIDEKLCHLGECKLSLNVITKVLIITPSNKDIVPIEAPFEQYYILRKNVICIFLDSADFALVFSEESHGKRIYNIISQKAQPLEELHQHELFNCKFIFPAMQELKNDDGNAELKNVLIEALKSFIDDEAFGNLFQEHEVYDLIDSAVKKIYRFRKRSVVSYDDAPLKRQRRASSMAKSVSNPDKIYPKDSVVTKGNFEMTTVPFGNRKVARLVIYHPNDRALCHEYGYNNSSNNYYCLECKNVENACVTAKLLRDANGEEFIQLDGKSHQCTYRNVLPSIYPPGFEVVPANSQHDHARLLIKSKGSNDLWYLYVYRANQGVYACTECKKKNTTAKLSTDRDGQQIVTLGPTMHNCHPKKKNEFF